LEEEIAGAAAGAKFTSREEYKCQNDRPNVAREKERL